MHYSTKFYWTWATGPLMNVSKKIIDRLGSALSNPMINISLVTVTILPPKNLFYSWKMVRVPEASGILRVLCTLRSSLRIVVRATPMEQVCPIVRYLLASFIANFVFIPLQLFCKSNLRKNFFYKKIYKKFFVKIFYKIFFKKKIYKIFYKIFFCKKNFYKNFIKF